MRYHGGKSRAGKGIASILQEVINKKKSLVGYCEPFCGACGVLSHMTLLNEIQIIAGDSNKSLICMWKSLCDGWVPDISNATRKRYIQLKGNGESSAEKGFLGHVVSYGGLYFKTFTESLVPRLPSSKRSVIRISEKLRNVKFQEGDYTQFSELENHLIFCDPPYEKNSRYFDENNKLVKFDSMSFWNWCKYMSEKNNIIVVNEMSGVQNSDEWEEVSLPSRLITYKDTVTESKESLFILENKKNVS